MDIITYTPTLLIMQTSCLYNKIKVLCTFLSLGVYLLLACRKDRSWVRGQNARLDTLYNNKYTMLRYIRVWFSKYVSYNCYYRYYNIL